MAKLFNKKVNNQFEQITGNPSPAKARVQSGPAASKTGKSNLGISIQQMKKNDKIRRRQEEWRLIQELEKEITKQRRVREAQLQQRRQSADENEQKEKPGKPPLTVPSGANKRPRLAGMGRRLQKAHQQSQPETVNKRIGG